MEHSGTPARTDLLWTAKRTIFTDSASPSWGRSSPRAAARPTGRGSPPWTACSPPSRPPRAGAAEGAAGDAAAYGRAGPADGDRELFGAVRARLDRIVRQLEEDPDAYAPIFLTTDDGATVAADWARGFLAGVQLRPAAWAPLTKARKEMRFLATIVSQLPDQDEQVTGGAGGADIAVFRREAREFIPCCVVQIGRFWKRRRGGAAARGAARGARRFN